jgi:pimeloyl-ACP methyl ester carboxylesterase
MIRIEKFVCNIISRGRKPWTNGVRPKKSHLVISVEERETSRLMCFDKIMVANVEHLGAVVLAPGIATNGWFFGLGANGEMYTEDSFASFLAQIGHIVYVYHPPYSEKAINNHLIPCGKLAKCSLAPKYNMPPELSFEDLIADIPVIIDAVCEDAELQAVAWIGFSLGGMLVLAYLAGAQRNRLDKVAFIGSPVILNTFMEKVFGAIADQPKGEAVLVRASANLGRYATSLASLPVGVLGLPALGWPAMALGNLSAAERRSFLINIIESIPPGLVRSFTRFQRCGFAPAGGPSFIEQLAGRQSQGAFSCIYATDDGLVSLENGYQIADVLSAALFTLPGAHNNLLIGSNRERTKEIVAGLL